MRLVLVVLATLAVAGHAQETFDVDHYDEAVRSYQRSHAPETIAPLAQWPASALRRAVDAVTKRPTGWDGDRLRAATLLHRDVVVGGHVDRTADVLLHLDMASRLTLALTPADGGARQFQTDWHFLAGHLLLSRSLADDAERFASRGLDRDAGNPRLGLLRGIVEEHRAHRLDPSLAEPSTIAELNLTPARRHLVLAGDHYRRVLSRDPASAEAVMRLGHVLFLSNQWTEARALLERAVAAPASARIRYLAALFLGTLHLRQNEPQAARRMFATAVRLSPDSQTPYIALSLAEQSLGRAAAAHSVIASWAKRPVAPPIDDPWWDYYYGVAEIGAVGVISAGGSPAARDPR